MPCWMNNKSYINKFQINDATIAMYRSVMCRKRYWMLLNLDKCR